jgi:cell division protein FtsB
MPEIKAPPRFLRVPWTGGAIAGRTLRWLLLIAVGLTAWLLLLGDSGLLRQSRLRREQDAVRKDIAELQRQESLLSEELRRLLNDPDYRERIAREEWGFKAPGERIYYLKRQAQ